MNALAIILLAFSIASGILGGFNWGQPRWNLVGFSQAFLAGAFLVAGMGLP